MLARVGRIFTTSATTGLCVARLAISLLAWLIISLTVACGVTILFFWETVLSEPPKRSKTRWRNSASTTICSTTTKSQTTYRPTSQSNGVRAVKTGMPGVKMPALRVLASKDLWYVASAKYRFSGDGTDGPLILTERALFRGSEGVDLRILAKKAVDSIVGPKGSELLRIEVAQVEESFVRFEFNSMNQGIPF